MNNSKEERLKIAVFIDFDNIAIGVKQSLNRNFDVGTVLEAIKEKGQVVTKIAYGDWKRNEDFSKAMTQHAVQMVQRNLTPGGDKNGADIALALDALEMAFTRDHINAFVIVGGDSDFIALVEKLKQYDKVVFIVGGRAFTSVILQKNCHEFISYENLIGVQSSGRRSTGRSQSTPASLETALPLIRRSLKILSDREVSPQLGLLKSTLLQLDSTFSERDYGVSSFRDFTQKLADAGYVQLKQVDRSLLVELKDIPETERKAASETAAVSGSQAAQSSVTAPEPAPAALQPSEATRALQELLRDSKSKPHWPLYLRSFKQFLKSLVPVFDEHQYGITSTYDLVRQAQKDGLLHVERNRQGILRIYPGELFPQSQADEIQKPDAAGTKSRKPETAGKKSNVSEGVSESSEAETETLIPESESDSIEQDKPGAKPKSKPRKRTKTTGAAKSGKRNTKSRKIQEPEAGKQGTSAAGKIEAENGEYARETSGTAPETDSQDVKTVIEDDRKESAEPEAAESSSQAESETEPAPAKPAVKRKRKTTTRKTASKKNLTPKTTRTRKTTTRKTTTKRKTKDEESGETKAE